MISLISVRLFSRPSLGSPSSGARQDVWQYRQRWLQRRVSSRTNVLGSASPPLADDSMVDLRRDDPLRDEQLQQVGANLLDDASPKIQRARSQHTERSHRYRPVGSDRYEHRDA